MRRVLVIVAAVLLTAVGAKALDVPEMHGHVNDLARLLSTDEAKALSDKLAAYERASGHQFVFLSVPTLGGASIEEFSVAVAHNWRLGDAKRDDGLLLLVAQQEHRVRIEVGYGLEQVIPDVTAAAVIRSNAAPAFKRGAWAEGANAAFDELARACATEPAKTETAETTVPSDPQSDPQIQHLADPGSSFLWIFLLSAAGIYAVVWWMLRSDRKRRTDDYGFDYQPSQHSSPALPVTRAGMSVGVPKNAARSGRLHETAPPAIPRRPAPAAAPQTTAQPARGDEGSTLTNVLLTGLLVEELATHASSTPAHAKEPGEPRRDEYERDTWPGRSSASLFGGSDRDNDSGLSWGGGNDDSSSSGGGGDFGGGGASGDF